MKRNIIFAAPAVIVGATVAVPFFFGDHPIQFDRTVPVVSGRSVTTTPSATTTSTATAVDPTAAPSEPAGKATASPTPSETYRGPKVARPWQPGSPEWGVQVYWLDDPADPDNYVQGKADRIVKYVVGLNANSMSISFPFYTKNKTSNLLSVEPTTPSPDRVALLIDTAHRAGLRTVVRPILDEHALESPQGDWRGNIEPADRTKWFASYTKLLKPYLKMAEEHRAARFTIGTEFNSLEGDARWQPLIEQAKAIYHGRIGYDANWDNYVKGPIAVPLEDIGVDAYFPAKKAGDDAPVSELVASWNSWLDKKGKGPLPGTTLTEVGIPAQQGAYQTPGDHYTVRAANDKAQPTWFTAVCQVAAERKLGGAYFWSTYFGTDPYKAANEKTPRMEFAGRPSSEQAIRDCFSTTYQVAEKQG
ncbi:glycoside hydrolase family 113 [Kitasatospora sp. NPDC051853]|uniref:glycoside hydrolase family 113 n=1 Tax=Kitasatospora sp. NPDC051853 TaxID=3364058 RepID=UPI00379B80A5